MSWDSFDAFALSSSADCCADVLLEQALVLVGDLVEELVDLDVGVAAHAALELLVADVEWRQLHPGPPPEAPSWTPERLLLTVSATPLREPSEGVSPTGVPRPRTG